MTEKTNGEVDRTIPVSAEDCDNVRNYSLHFGVEISPALTDAMANFEKDTSSYEFMLDFKRELCAWLTTCGHESCQDSLWEHPTGAAADILFDLQFDKDVNEILATEEPVGALDAAKGHSASIDSAIESIKDQARTIVKNIDEGKV